MPVQTKICGLSTPDTLEAAIKGGANHVGFVFFATSPRNIGFDAVRALSSLVPAHIKKVGVFVDPDPDLLDQAIDAGSLDVIQFHKATPAKAVAIKRHSKRECWAAISVRTAADLGASASFRGAADFLLYDAATPDDSALPGGSGLRFDWNLLKGFAHPLPWGLAGGLTTANVGDAIRETGAALVDISSGVESAPGIKDVDKIVAFLKATRSS